MYTPKSIQYNFPTQGHFEMLQQAIASAMKLPPEHFNSVHEGFVTASLLQSIAKRLFQPKARIKLEYHELAVVVVALRHFVMECEDSLEASAILMFLEPYLASNQKEPLKKAGYAQLHSPKVDFQINHNNGPK